MSNSLSADEDWSIISSSSDFEDESTTGSSVRASPDSEGATPSGSEIAYEDIDESTCTIRGDATTEAQKLTAENPDILDPLLAGESLTGEPSGPASGSVPVSGYTTTGRCGVVHAASTVRTYVNNVDQYLRAISRRLFGVVFSDRLELPKEKVASKGTVNIALHQHAVYSVLAALERNEDFLLYYVVALLAAAASVLAIWPTGVQELTFSSRFHQLWIDTMYEPEEKGFSSYFHAHKPKQLKVSRYFDVASKRAYGVISSNKVATVALYHNIKQDPYRFLRHWQQESSSKFRHTYHDAGFWVAKTYPRIVSDAKGLSGKFNRKTIESLLTRGQHNVLNWFLTTWEAANGTYAHTIIPTTELVAARAKHWAETCKAVTGDWLNRTLSIGKEVQRTELTPLASYTSNQAQILYSKFKIDSQVAAIHTYRMFHRWSNASLAYGQLAWQRVKTLPAEFQVNR